MVLLRLPDQIYWQLVCRRSGTSYISGFFVSGLQNTGKTAMSCARFGYSSISQKKHKKTRQPLPIQQFQFDSLPRPASKEHHLLIASSFSSVDLINTH